MAAAGPVPSDFALTYAFMPQFDRAGVIHELRIYLADVEENMPIAVVLVGATPENVVRECRNTWPPPPPPRPLGPIDQFYGVAFLILLISLLGILLYAYLDGRYASSMPLFPPRRRNRPLPSRPLVVKSNYRNHQSRASSSSRIRTAFAPSPVPAPTRRYSIIAYVRYICPLPWQVIRFFQRLKARFKRLPRLPPTLATTTTLLNATAPTSHKTQRCALLRSISNKHSHQNHNNNHRVVLAESVKSWLQWVVNVAVSVSAPRFVFVFVFKRMPLFLWRAIGIHCIRFVSRIITRQLLGYGVVSRNNSNSSVSKASTQRKRSILLAVAQLQKQQQTDASGKYAIGRTISSSSCNTGKQEQPAAGEPKQRKCAVVDSPPSGRRSRTQRRQPNRTNASKSTMNNPNNNGRCRRTTRNQRTGIWRSSANSEVASIIGDDELNDSEASQSDVDVAVNDDGPDESDAEIACSETEEVSLNTADDVDCKQLQSPSDDGTTASSSPSNLDNNNAEDSRSASPSAAPPTTHAAARSSAADALKQAASSYILQHDESVIRIPLDNNKTIVLRVETTVQSEKSGSSTAAPMSVPLSAETLAKLDKETIRAFEAAVAAGRARRVSALETEWTSQARFTRRQRAVPSAAESRAVNKKRTRTKTNSTSSVNVDSAKGDNDEEWASNSVAGEASSSRTTSSYNTTLHAQNETDADSITASHEEQQYEKFLFQQWKKQQFNKSKKKGRAVVKVSSFAWPSPPPSSDQKPQLQSSTAATPVSPPRYRRVYPLPSPPHNNNDGSNVVDSLPTTTALANGNTNRSDAGDATQNGFVADDSDVNTNNIWGSDEPLFARSFLMNDSSEKCSSEMLLSPSAQQNDIVSPSRLLNSTLFVPDLPWSSPLSPFSISSCNDMRRSMRDSGLFLFSVDDANENGSGIAEITADNGRSALCAASENRTAALSFCEQLRNTSSAAVFENDDATSNSFGPPQSLWPSLEGLMNNGSTSSSSSSSSATTNLFGSNLCSHNNASVISGRNIGSRSLLSRMTPRILLESDYGGVGGRQCPSPMIGQPAPSVSPLVISADDYIFVQLDSADDVAVAVDAEFGGMTAK